MKSFSFSDKMDAVVEVVENPELSQIKKNIFLIDFSSVEVGQLQKIVFSSKDVDTRVFCFCLPGSPLIPLSSLDIYAKWLSKGSLEIISVNSNNTTPDAVLHTITFFASRLSSKKFSPNDWTIHILSSNKVLTTVAELLKFEKYDVVFDVFDVVKTTAKTQENVEELPSFVIRDVLQKMLRKREKLKDVKHLSDLQTFLKDCNLNNGEMHSFVSFLKKNGMLNLKNETTTFNWSRLFGEETDDNISSSSSHKKRETPYTGAYVSKQEKLNLI